MNTTDIKKLLLAGTALVAIGLSGPVFAADFEINGTTAVPTDASGVGATDDILNATDTNTPDASYFDVDGNATAATINIDESAILAIYNAGAGATDALSITSYTDIAATKTLTLVFGGSEADGSGTDGAVAATLAIGTTLGDTGATTLTRGGTLAVVGTANENDGAGILTVAGNTLLTAVSVTGGAGGAADDGAAVTATFGDASSDTFNVTGLTVTGGAGDDAANKAGGAATVTVNGAATIGATGITMTGGEGADNAAGVGGAATLTFANGATLSGAVALTGGG